jgi:hypothetical protein
MAEVTLPASTGLYVPGLLRCGSASLPTNCVSDTNVIADANIAASKLQMRRKIVVKPSTTTAAAADGIYIAHVFGAPGTVVDFKAAAVTDPLGTDICEVDLHLATAGGSFASMLDSGTEVEINSSTGNNTLVAGTLDAAKVTRAATDVLAVEFDDIAGTAGTAAAGVYAVITIDEEAS